MCPLFKSEINVYFQDFLSLFIPSLEQQFNDGQNFSLKNVFVCKDFCGKHPESDESELFVAQITVRAPFMTCMIKRKFACTGDSWKKPKLSAKKGGQMPRPNHCVCLNTLLSGMNFDCLTHLWSKCCHEIATKAPHMNFYQSLTQTESYRELIIYVRPSNLHCTKQIVSLSNVFTIQLFGFNSFLFLTSRVCTLHNHKVQADQNFKASLKCAACKINVAQKKIFYKIVHIKVS